MKQLAIICDLDGTLCNVDHRRHFLDETPPDWKSFNESCVTDKMNRWCAILLQRMRGGFYPCQILLVSGRDEEYRPHTEEWLEQFDIWHNGLFMRKVGDDRPDEVIKEEIYRTHIQPHYDVLFVVDDRKKVVDMWRRIGLVCLQCAEGNF